MHNFRRLVLIPVSLAAITAAIAGYLKVASPYKIPFILSAFLLAALASFSVDPPSLDQKDQSSNSIRSTLLHLGTFLAIAFALLFGVLGFSVSRAQQEKQSSSSLNLPSGTQSGTGSSSLSPIRPTSQPIPPTTTPIPGKGQPSEARAAPSAVEDFVQKYVDEDALHRGGQPQWAVLISDQNHAQFPELNSAASAAITDAGYRDVPIFRPSLVRDDKLGELYDADPKLVRKLGEICDGFIIARAESNLRQGSTPEGLYTAELSLQIRVVQVPSGVVRKEFSISGNGAGFSAAEAQANAQKRVATSLKEQLKSAL